MVFSFSGRTKQSLTLRRWKSPWGTDLIAKPVNERILWMGRTGGEKNDHRRQSLVWVGHRPAWPRHVSFSQSRAGISRPAVCAGRGAAIHSYIFWVPLLTTRPSPSNYDIIENDLKPNVRALLSEPVFTENSCLNRHLEGIRITFFMSQRECVSVCVQVCIYAWVGYLGTYTDKLFVLEVFA